MPTLNSDNPLSETYSSSRTSSTVFHVVSDLTPPASGDTHASSIVFHAEPGYSRSSSKVFQVISDLTPPASGDSHASSLVFHAESGYSRSSSKVFQVISDLTAPASGDSHASSLVFHAELEYSRSSSKVFYVISDLTPPASGNSHAPSSVFNAVSESSRSSSKDFQASPPTSGGPRASSISFFPASGNPLSKSSANIVSPLPNTRPPLGNVKPGLSSSLAPASVSTHQSSTNSQARDSDYEEKRRLKETKLRAYPLSQLPMLMMVGVFDLRKQAAHERYIQNELKKFDSDYVASIARPR